MDPVRACLPARQRGPASSRRHALSTTIDATDRRLWHLAVADLPLRMTVSGDGLMAVVWDGERVVQQGWLKPGDRRLVAPPAEAMPPPSSLPRFPGRVSLVICTRDRPAALAHCLASLAGQSRAPDEVIVVDNASAGPDTRRVAEAAGVGYVREDRPGLDIARNTGWRTARGEIVAYLDDDAEPHPRWLDRLVAGFALGPVEATTGLVLPAALDSEAARVFERLWSFGHGVFVREFGPDFYARTRARGCPAWEIGAGTNMAFRRTALARLGGFDDRLDVGAAGCSGDSEMWYRLLAAGGTCRYEPEAIVFHRHRTEIAALERQIRAYMRGHVAALMVQHERTGDRGNLRRVYATLPAMYARRALGRLLRGRREHNRLLRHEVAGAVAGLIFYLRTPRP